MPILTPLPSMSARASRPQARHARCARTARLSVRAAAVAPDTSGLSASTPYDRVFNFSAGPACLPVDVLEQVRDDLLNYKGSGMSVMEMSHRGKTFFSIYEKAVADLRTLLGVPDNFKILMLQGGASTQFSAVPLNLTAAGETIDHVVTGSWSKKATAEAKKYCNVNVAAQGDNKSIPDVSDWRLSPDSRFVHYCDNETIQGVEFKSVPDVGDRLLIADMSSDFCSKPIDFTRHGVIYAGAQKNIGPSGVTIVIVRDDLIGNARPETPTMLDYKTHAENDSMYNTPPCWGIYVCGLVFDKLLREGGIEKMQARNVEKATLLYDAIEQSEGFFCSPVDPAVRSMMNVPFTIPSKPELEAVFIKDAAELGLVTLKGHRSVGGMRASIYNSMPPEGCKKLAEFMKTFAASH